MIFWQQRSAGEGGEGGEGGADGEALGAVVGEIILLSCCVLMKNALGNARHGYAHGVVRRHLRQRVVVRSPPPFSARVPPSQAGLELVEGWGGGGVLAGQRTPELVLELLSGVPALQQAGVLDSDAREAQGEHEALQSLEIHRAPWKGGLWRGLHRQEVMLSRRCCQSPTRASILTSKFLL